MKISHENTSLHDALFKNRANYKKWAPYFYDEFVKKYSNDGGRFAGVMTPSMVNVDDSYTKQFFEWLRIKGISIEE